MNLIKQSQSTYANRLKPGASIEITDTMVSDGGLLLAEFGGGKIILNNVGSKGRVHGKGMYFVGVFNKPVKSLYLRGIPDNWIVSSTGTKKGEQPGEAAFRINSHVGIVEVVGVNFRCGTWINPEGRKTWWKQVVQIRHADDVEFRGCKIVGPHELGAIEKGQVVKEVRYVNCGLTHMPKFTKARESVKRVIFHDCYWIDESGKPTGKKIVNQAW